jgi:epoxyqueuosine reductase
MNIRELIQAEALRLGFTLSGVTTIAPPDHLAVYQSWVKDGRHAGMAYLGSNTAQERRANPAFILPEAQSLLMVALDYPSPFAVSEESSSSPKGRVASYAWGHDYHDIIPGLLDELVNTLEKYLGFSIIRRSYTDTGAILERDLAQRAGLGWAGKNTCLISPRHGSFFFIGETFLNIRIEPDLPFKSDHCGSCHRCIDGCPTSAILNDRTIDSSRCISYLTIENKTSIPSELRPGVGNWVFGCDVCQMVCPWNIRFGARSGHSALAPNYETARPVLQTELKLSPQEFKVKYQHSPIMRAKRRGYLRNVAVALGNQADTTVVPDLAAAVANDSEPLVRGHAAWALGRMHNPGARFALEKALKSEPETAVLAEIRAALNE